MRYIDRIGQARLQGYRAASAFYRQAMCDLAVLVLGQDFKFTPDRLLKFCQSLDKLHDDFCDVFNEDSKDIEYSKHTMDEALKKVCGEYFIPWEERYEQIPREKGHH